MDSPKNEQQSAALCPQCKGSLERVRYPLSSMLNREQFDSIRAGDYFCATCKGTEAKTGYKYWWEKDLKRESAAPESQPKQGCCAARDALKEIRFHVKADPQMERTHYYVNRTGAAEIARMADAALAAPCECAQLREKLAVADAKIETLTAVVNEFCEDAKQLQATADLYKGAADELRVQLASEAARLDWLEGELLREPLALNLGRRVQSLFRRNFPITRAAIDAAMKEAEGS